MQRAIWSGSISFGLVNVPIKLYSAVKAHDVHFRQLEEKTGSRVRVQRVSEETGKEVPYDDIVKGYELSKDHYVPVTSEDLEAVEPEDTRVIDIEDFVDLDEVDPIQFEKTYWLAAEKNAGATKAYGLLVRAMEESRRVGIGRFVMRGKQYLAAVRPMDGTLALHTMYFADEIVDTSSIDGTSVRAKVGDRELKAARQLIDSLTTTWDPERYHDTYQEALLEMIERKAKGEEIVTPAPTKDTGEVLDLMAALEASIASSKGRGGKNKDAGAASKSRAKPANRDDDLESLSKTELMERAAAAGIQGRSSMTKAELIDALRDAGGARHRRSA